MLHADLVTLEVALALHQRELDPQQLVEDQTSPRRLDVGHRLGLVDPVEGVVATLETESGHDPRGHRIGDAGERLRRRTWPTSSASSQVESPDFSDCG